MLINAIILTNTKDLSYYEMTNKCIDTLVASSTLHEFKIFVFESNQDAISKGFIYHQPEVEVLIPNEPFNFNRFYNLGLEKCKGEYVWLLNNDLIFDPGSTDKALEAFNIDPELQSVSPWDPRTHSDHKSSASLLYGYTIIRYVCGWAILAKKSLFDVIGPYDERFIFWYQDNDYSENLKKHNIKHALVRDAVVNHLDHRSHKTIPKGESRNFKQGLREIFIEKWKNKPSESTSLF